MPDIVTNLWFDMNGLEAAEFYCGIFPNSGITATGYGGDAGPNDPGTPVTVQFTLDGTPFTIINGGPQFPFTEAMSLFIACVDQAEVDRYWAALGDGGEYGQCGWLKDRYGVSWQVVPTPMGELLGDPDPERSARAMKAMLGMSKIDLGVIRAAADGDA